MYRQYYSKNVRRRGRGGYGRGSRYSGGNRIKAFDPTSIVNSVAEAQSSSTQEITHCFGDFGISENFLENIMARGYQTPTPIQDQAIEPIMAGRDLIGIANTGTGKTAAFLIPLIDKILKNRNQGILIIAPTRELANQIRDELTVLVQGLDIHSVLCIGGASIGRQIDDLEKNPNFVIGTPGRIQDLANSQYLNLSAFSSVVLDEADLMVDIGFLYVIKEIIALLPTPRQSLFFSATIDNKVNGVLQSFVKDPVTVTVKTRETAENIEQKILKVARDKKIEELHSLLIQKEFEKVLVFGRTKRGVQKLSDELSARGFKAETIHGNKTQGQRARALEKFKNDYVQVLIATDVASRGLDIPNVSHVINYDLPESREAYIHRIGRTGRIDKKGVALTFID